MSKPRKPRRKADGSYEISFSCPVCGSNKCEVNSVTNKYHCWSCAAGGLSGNVLSGRYQGQALSSFPSAKDGPGDELLGDAARSPDASKTRVPDDLTNKFPIFALQECVRRRQEPQWLIQRYRVRWSYLRGRLWFPAGDGGVLRSVLPWEDPKTICVPGSQGKTLIGEHRLDEHDGPLRLVLTEGDWKAVSIPIPWTGLGLQGVELTQYQRFRILTSAPLSIVVMLDSGYWREAQKIVETLLPFRAVRVDLPEKVGGPDDMPRHELVKLLLSTERKG